MEKHGKMSLIGRKQDNSRRKQYNSNFNIFLDTSFHQPMNNLG
jgi:hypothetical protein